MIAYLGLSTNLGDKELNFYIAKQKIQLKCQILIESKVYETEAWGLEDQPDFLNQCIQIKTDLQAEQLLQFLQNIEAEMGRVKTEKYGPRIIDLDILLYENDIIETDDLIIPHPQMEFRNFVLMPLSEIAGELVHPILNLTINQLLQICPDDKQAQPKSNS
jgi:2-amino-4-hydroxy-6-hydroxymethyldihydropteridine diphosphokinase